MPVLWLLCIGARCPLGLHLATGRASFAYTDLNGAELWRQQRELLYEVLLLHATATPLLLDT